MKKNSIGKEKLPIFFPDATRGVLRTLDSVDLKNTKTPGILVNTYHLMKDLGEEKIKKFSGIGPLMNWDGPIISDSGGFQIMTLAKREGSLGKITDRGVIFRTEEGQQTEVTPEDSIRFQMNLKTDLMVVLDDFTNPLSSYEEAKLSVERTIKWAKRSNKDFLIICQHNNLLEKYRPLLIGVVQGADFLDLRKECTEKLVEIGFDGLGYGGWPMKEGEFNYEVAKVMAENSPKDYLLYGLGVGKPEDIVGCFKLGFTIFDCVLPTRDARHGRLYVYDAKTIEEIDITKEKFYHFENVERELNATNLEPVSTACDCLLCKNYSKAYLRHLFKIKDSTAHRLATIHNLRFYSILMEKLKSQFPPLTYLIHIPVF